MKNIEVELRSFISKEQYEKLLEFFLSNAELVKEDAQETLYFDCPEDLRIQKNKYYAKIWMKKGKIHDDCREEIEVKTSVEDFENLEKLFLSLGYNVQIKWFRTRNKFLLDGIKVCLDYTKGYGYIIELEKICSENEQAATLELLKQKFQELAIPITPREEFEKKFIYYQENWQELVK